MTPDAAIGYLVGDKLLTFAELPPF